MHVAGRQGNTHRPTYLRGVGEVGKGELHALVGLRPLNEQQHSLEQLPTLLPVVPVTEMVRTTATTTKTTTTIKTTTKTTTTTKTRTMTHNDHNSGGGDDQQETAAGWRTVQGCRGVQIDDTGDIKGSEHAS
jgi:hypothetical protein